jgi:hypothetical protein
MKIVRHSVYMLIILTIGTMLICCGNSSSTGSGSDQTCKKQNVTQIATHADCETYASRNGCTGGVSWTDSSFICEAYKCSSCDK